MFRVVYVDQPSLWAFTALLYYVTVRDNHPDRPLIGVPAMVVLRAVLNIIAIALFLPSHDFSFVLAQRALAAFLAIAVRRFGLNFAARAEPPFNPPRRPSATAFAFLVLCFMAQA